MGKKVLLIKLSSLGDVIFNVPLANVLKDNGYEVSWLVSEKGIDIVKNNPCVDKVFLLPLARWKKSKNIFKNLEEIFELLKLLRKENFDIAIDTQMRLKSLFWTKFCGAKRRIIAKDAKEFSILGANEVIPKIKEGFNTQIVLTYLKFAEYLGLDIANIKVSLPPSTKETKEKIDALLKDIDNTKPLLAIAPATTWKGKHWDIINWQSLIKKIGNDYNLVFTGTKNDIGLITNIGGDKYINLAGKTNLVELIELLNRMDLVISLDSGTTHLAWASQNPKIISIFCCTPKTLYSPIGDESKYIGLIGNIACQPCHHKKCRSKNNYACTKSPNVDEVINSINKLLSKE